MIGKKKNKSYLKHNNNKQIWRILISETDKLVLEERDPKTKEVFFSCYDLSTKTKTFSNFQFEEKAWIGIEAMENDIIIFHYYRKPDMPQHKGFFAFSVNDKKILWTNDTYAYFFSDKEKIVAFIQQFEGKSFAEIDLMTGEIVRDLGEDFSQVNLMKQDTQAKKSYTDYLFPEVFNPLNDDLQFDCIRNSVSGFLFSGQVEYFKKDDFLYFTFHEKKGELFTQHFYIWSTADNSLFFSDVLNKNIPNYAVDSFFIYKRFLFVIKEKQIVEIILVNT